MQNGVFSIRPFGLFLTCKCFRRGKNRHLINLCKEMAKKLYVGGLNYDTTEDTLKSSFEQAGTVESAVVIMDRMSGRSKGFGFVEMGTEDEAKAAIDMWDGKELEGRTLRVNEARPREENGGNRGGGDRY